MRDTLWNMSQVRNGSWWGRNESEHVGAFSLTDLPGTRNKTRSAKALVRVDRFSIGLLEANEFLCREMPHVLTVQPVVVAVEIPLERFVYVLESASPSFGRSCVPACFAFIFLAIGILVLANSRQVVSVSYCRRMP